LQQNHFFFPKIDKGELMRKKTPEISLHQSIKIPNYQLFKDYSNTSSRSTDSIPSGS